MGATGVGALTGALTLATRTGVSGLGRWVWMAATGFGTSLILFSFSRHMWLSVAMLIPAGFCMMTADGRQQHAAAGDGLRTGCADA